MEKAFAVVTLYSDGGGKVYAALKPVYSKDLVFRFIGNLLSHNNNEEKPAVVKMVNVNGQTGLLVRGVDNVKTVICFHVKNGQIVDIYCEKSRKTTACVSSSSLILEQRRERFLYGAISHFLFNRA